MKIKKLLTWIIVAACLVGGAVGVSKNKVSAGGDTYVYVSEDGIFFVGWYTEQIFNDAVFTVYDVATDAVLPGFENITNAFIISSGENATGTWAEYSYGLDCTAALEPYKDAEIYIKVEYTDEFGEKATATITYGGTQLGNPTTTNKPRNATRPIAAHNKSGKATQADINSLVFKKNSIVVKWDSVKKATGYTVFASTKPNTGFKKVASTKASKRSATIKKIAGKKVNKKKKYYIYVVDNDTKDIVYVNWIKGKKTGITCNIS